MVFFCQISSFLSVAFFKILSFKYHIHSTISQIPTNYNEKVHRPPYRTKILTTASGPATASVIQLVVEHRKSLLQACLDRPQKQPIIEKITQFSELLLSFISY